MRHLAILSLAILLIPGTGCTFHDSHKMVEDRVTEGFVATYVRPLSDPVLVLVEKGNDLPPGLLASNRVLLVELGRKGKQRQTIFEDKAKKPPSGGMTTGVDNAKNIGMYYPRDARQPEIEVRMNYFCDNGDFVAVHVSVPNPLLVPKLKNPVSAPPTPGQKPRPEKPKSDAVVVQILDEPLPQEAARRAAFLWNHFANKPDEEKFSSYGTGKWKENFAVFADALVKKADDKKLDSLSLRKMLDLVLEDSKGKIAYLPVGAYQTTLDGKPVWIIIVKWEYPSMGDESELGHIRMFAFDQDTLKRVGFNTCG